MKHISTFLSVVTLLWSGAASATLIETQFNTSDGFITGDFGDVTLTDGAFSATFSGGQQQQMFDGPSYNVGPAGYLFVNGTFDGAAPPPSPVANENPGANVISFGGDGAAEVSFFAAVRGGALGSVTALDINGIAIQTIGISSNNNNPGLVGNNDPVAPGAVLTAPVLTSFTAGLGQAIGSLVFTFAPGSLDGAFAIDSFSARAVPEPSTLAALMLGVGGVGAWRRRRQVAVEDA